MGARWVPDRWVRWVPRMGATYHFTDGCHPLEDSCQVGNVLPETGSSIPPGLETHCRFHLVVVVAVGSAGRWIAAGETAFRRFHSHFQKRHDETSSNDPLYAAGLSYETVSF